MPSKGTVRYSSGTVRHGIGKEKYCKAKARHGGAKVKYRLITQWRSKAKFRGGKAQPSAALATVEFCKAMVWFSRAKQC